MGAKSYDRATRKDREEEKESGRGREMVGVGGYQGQEQLRSPTPAVPSEGRQQGSRWAISGRILAAAATAGQRLRAARDVSAGGGGVTQRRYHPFYKTRRSLETVTLMNV